MSNFKIGSHYDGAFKTMQPDEILSNLESIAYDVTEQSYTKNLTEEELAGRKDRYSEIGIRLSELAERKKAILDEFKELEKEPRSEAKEILDSIKFKSEQKYGKLYMIDDQDARMMYLFDNNGICVDARPLTKKESQLKLTAIKNGTDE